MHELGILLANYMLRTRGIRTIFFGQTVPLNAMEEVYHKLAPSHILTSLTTKPDPADTQSFVNSLGQKFKNSQILVTGSRVIGQDIVFGEKMTAIKSFGELEEIIEVTKQDSQVSR